MVTLTITTLQKRKAEYIPKEWKDNKDLLEDLKLTKNSDTYSNLKGFSTTSSTNSEIKNSFTGTIENGYQYIQKIKDHSVKLEIKRGEYINSGTGWFLDYEIPISPKKYPTKWFIATNAHVISKFKFFENPYNQNITPVGKLSWLIGLGGGVT